MKSIWFYGTLAAIALVIACAFAKSSVSASHALAAVDCDSTYAPADGTFLALLVPHDTPCADEKDELLSTHYKRQVEAGAAGFVALSFAFVAITRRRAALS